MPRKLCCASSCGWSTASQATIPSAGYSGCSTRRHSNQYFAGSWRNLPRSCTAWWRWTAKPCAVRSRGRKTTPLQLVNVWAAEARLAIAQRLAPKRNEVAAALEALELLALDGCTVTADALHCHAEFAQCILHRGGQYALALKANQSALFTDAQILLEPLAEHPQVQQPLTGSHGRDERRQAVVVPAAGLARKHDFPGIKALARIELQRRVGDAEEPPIVRYFLLSRRWSPARVLAITRAHWGIENQLHWVLDVVFDEDRARNRKDHGPENLAILRKLALNTLRSHPSTASIRRKIKRAGWDDAFLTSMLAQMR